MHPHGAEIVAEYRLNRRPYRTIERLPLIPQHLMHDAGGRSASALGQSDRLGLKWLRCSLLACSRWVAKLRRCGGNNGIGVGHARHLIGDAVRLVLKRIVDLSDDKLWLYDACRAWCTRGGSH
jgi:hypothetical protein